MKSTYIFPSETPPTELQIKKALLTYDKVLIPDPADRDLFPSNLFLQAMAPGIPIPFGINSGPVRELGKIPNYDNKFDELLDRLSFARRQGIIDVVSTYDASETTHMTIGSIPTGGYPLNPAFVLAAYRNTSRDQESLQNAIQGDHELLSLTDESIVQISQSAPQSADMTIMGDPKLPDIESEFARSHLAQQFSDIARARVGSTIKTIGYCTSKNLAPSIHNIGSINIANHILKRATKVIDEAAENDPTLILRHRVIDVCYEEFIDEDVLDTMSIDDVLRYRTRLWGVGANRRDELLRHASALAKENITEEKFDAEIRKSIYERNSTWSELETERKSLSFNIKCDIIENASKASAFAIGGELAGKLALAQTSLGAATLLLTGCILAAQKIKEYKPVRDSIERCEAEFEDNSCFGIVNYYRGR